jgi:hypothetical protein
MYSIVALALSRIFVLILNEVPSAVLLHPPQIPNGLPLDWTQTANGLDFVITSHVAL